MFEILKDNFKRILSFFLAFSALLTVFTSFEADMSVCAQENTDYNENTLSSYMDYFERLSEVEYPNKNISIDLISDISNKTGEIDIYDNFEGLAKSSVYTGNESVISWDFTVEQAGAYNLLFGYYPIEGEQGTIERSLYIDGKIPFKEAKTLSFERIWANADKEIMEDVQGNQIMIEQIEAPRWVNKYAMDPSGATDEPLKFYLTAGKHTLTLQAVMEPMLIGDIAFVSVADSSVLDYSEAIKQYPSTDKPSKENVIILEGEKADRKSTQMLYPLCDQTSPKVHPYDFSRIVYNTIGRNQWTNAGQWIEWDFYVPESGAYSLSAHFKQALKEGRSSVRSIYIDGKLPFKEASNWMFPYDSVWQTEYFSDNNNEPYSFYLTEGNHTIRLMGGLGIYSTVIAKSADHLQQLNDIYRSIIAISGANPDQYRDYKFDEMIPDVIEEMKALGEELKELEKEIIKLDGNTNKVVAIKRIYEQIDLMLEDTDTISVRLTSFKDNIASFGTWINEQRGQPLELDRIVIASSENKLEDGEGSFFELVLHNIRRFLVSFSTDYQTIGQTSTNSEKSVKVWMTTSQDQSQILRQLVTSDFTPKSGIAAEIQLVSTKALLPAILANKGPDVSLGMNQADVNNLALRNALYDLENFSDIGNVKEEFYDYALVPFEWNKGLFALPETQTWPMLFYRSDILEEMNISLSELDTWDSILSSVLPKLKKSSLTFGIMPTIQNYLTFVYQRGGELYINDGRNSGLSSSQAVESMKLFSMLYKQYGFELSFDFSNRFRTGEMPIAISDFTSYNSLTLFAGEIKGLWGMLPIPGTLQEDGTVDHTSVSTVTGTVMMSNTKDSAASWEFMTWWTSAAVQNEFGKRLEAVVGTSSRYNTANKKAMSQVRWDSSMRNSMLEQSENLKAYPEVPGGYFTMRLFNNAFRSIVYDNEDVRESMIGVGNDIDLEIANKRKEYGIK